ncbi:unnamed protein product [Oikopleura dioica]|uniref:Transcription factor CBF/NF-Y/archaeal histone domain-containing protein n=1 Tax=Oikopleura dioica TaxID=34765 RepID=E4YTH0_OIKDI|nr:unnamed protein product [Oikopleura dioica]CBY41343.1 unnamed protein product [Oikopleura dioica]
MPPKRRFPNSRFQPSRIKKIMQTDEEIGKVAKAVPVLISRAIELFMEKLLHDAETAVSQSKTYRTILPQHIKQAITNTQSLNFLSGLVENISDLPSGDKSAPVSRKRPHPKISKKESQSESFVYPSVIVSPPVKREKSTEEEPNPETAKSSTLPLAPATAALPTTSHTLHDSQQSSLDSLTKTIPG